MKNYRRQIVALFFAALIIILMPQPTLATSGGSDSGEQPTPELEVEIYTGPEFTEGDVDEIKTCSSGIYWNFFPMDFLFNGGDISEGSSECPSIDFFGYEENFCWVLDLYRLISPGVTLSLIIYGIFNL